MCNEEEITTTIKLAKAKEDADPKAAAELYLKAAQKLIHYADHHPQKQQKTLELAQKIYSKGKVLTTVKPQLSLLAKQPKSTTTNFDSIGGLEDLKEEIKLKIIEPLKDPSLFSYYGKNIGGGILMYGPPGCGKSLIAKATAGEASVNFLHVKSSDLKSKYVGETERNIAELFEKARETQPTIIFFDEFEVLGQDRNTALPHEKNAVGELLTQMDGMDAKDQQILLLAATNVPWAIDPALRREGRFGTSILIPPPDHKAREQIFTLHMQDRPIKNINFTQLASLTAGLSGADIKSICEKATDIPLKESLKNNNRRPITMQDVHQAIKQTDSVMKQWFNQARSQVRQSGLEESFKDLLEKASEISGKPTLA